VIERLTVARIGELRPWTRKLPEDAWIELARLAGILARFEQFFRAGLLGYLFADTDDAYRIRRVGFGALRRRRSIFWPSQELIDLLAGRPSPPVEHWRGGFAGLLASRTSAAVARGGRRLDGRAKHEQG
jgi:hypothetical protein